MTNDMSRETELSQDMATTGSSEQKAMDAGDLTSRTSKMVGRKDEVERLKKYLNARERHHFLYY